MGGNRSVCGSRRTLLLALLVSLIATAALPASAGAFLYWANSGTGSAGTGSIGHASNDGTGVNQSLIPNLDACGIAVDATHIYWANGTSIGRANLDGNPASVNPSFITGATSACGVAVDGAHIYWGNGNALGRANIDGSSVNQSFITGANTVCGVALDAGHVYWANRNPGPGTVGRADLSGGSVNQSFVTGGAFLCGVAVDAGHVYWGNNGTGYVGRANIDGSSVNQTFINAGASSGPSGIAVDATHIYWTAEATGAIGRANTDGSSVNQSFIPGGHSPVGVAVDSLPEASTSVASCSPSSFALPGSATCTATVSGSAEIPTGTVAFTTSGSGAFSPASSCTLVATGAATAACQVTYTPSAPGAVTISIAYPGDENHQPSSGAAALDVSPLGTPAVTPPQRTLTITTKGSGTVTSQPGGITCRPTCTHAYDDGTQVTLTASPASAFTGWSGACSGRGSCQVTMTADRSVVATFAARPSTKISKSAVNSKTRRATFRFKGVRATKGFQCSLVSKKHKKPKFTKCRSPKTYKRLRHGTYTFEVRALGTAGADPSPAKKTFRIR
ncbi:MAG: hypothetical protein JWM71_1193 [Solirubrobacteraceae bacterium]|nr:hypothetical protein [Solirubrobacteraceae bacterium]